MNKTRELANALWRYNAKADRALLEAKHKNRQKSGFASGYVRQRKLARKEWPDWQPDKGAKTVAKFWKQFDEEHHAPADPRTMRRWLKGLY